MKDLVIRHFSNNTEAEDILYGLFKLQTILDYFLTKFETVYKPK
jgi:hypothetical protein